jgi:diguanylate cyclase (GGDEF)-like protein
MSNNLENIKRLRPIMNVVAAIIIIQIVLYWLGDNAEFKVLIVVKAIIVFSIGIIQYIFKKIEMQSSLKKHSEIIIQVVTLWLLILAVFSSFYAQEISSDITIYIMVLFVITAGLRMKSATILFNLIISFSVFFIGMPFFQHDSEFLMSHIINGFIINILAYIISKMFFQYTINEYQDKLEIENNNVLLKKSSERDDLTGLYNMRTVNEILDGYVKRPLEDEGKLFLGMLDLDHFKEVNDKYGHTYGDKVLKIVANKILENIRENDIVGRFGGDEFIIIFKDRNPKNIESIMNRLLSEISAIKFKDVNISFSCGIAVWDGETGPELFERADQYMYDMKHSGKNKIKFQSEKIKGETDGRKQSHICGNRS